MKILHPNSTLLPTIYICWGRMKDTIPVTAQDVNTGDILLGWDVAFASSVSLSSVSRCTLPSAWWSGLVQTKWFLHETAHNKALGLSCVTGSSFLLSCRLLFSFLYIREKAHMSTVDISPKIKQATLRQPRWMNSTTGKSGKYVSVILQCTAPLKFKDRK